MWVNYLYYIQENQNDICKFKNLSESFHDKVQNTSSTPSHYKDCKKA